MSPPAHLLVGKVGAEKWHKNTLTTVRETNNLTKRCGKEALELWCPIPPPGQAEETPYERKVRKDAWKFKLDVLATGEVKTKPPEGPGVTLWKSKVKPPPWISKIALPCCRDFSTMKNNEFVAQYVRDTRLVVSRLRQALIEINEQFKALVRLREQLDQMLDKVRQSLVTNKQSQAIREHRPEPEKILDKVDGLMKWEKVEFRKLKAKLEGTMAMLGDHLKVLGTCRQTLNTLCSERGRVLDLIPQPLRMVILGAGRDSWLSLSRPSSPWVERNETPIPDPVGPFTPECAAVLEDARRLTFLTKNVLLQVQKAISEAQDIRNTVHNIIENSLQGKRDETLHHKERLDMTLGGTRSTLHRCQRFQHEMRITRGMALGPASSKYLETRERLTRPVVQVFQRHVGTQLPEAAILNQSTAQLDRSIADTGDNISHLKATQRYLRECIHDKQTGYDIDGSIKRLRQRRMHPHTTMKETLELVYT
ncbi:coiled-coil domain-containing protein 105 [Sceloporus undulatus]|uniref:coiled-coil domain-containing protein 105 n=1 Tax=Sceloporus undulatus TaxID=8520 RepID=UPI001C4D1ADC|nr:coiled-coil domain-containing protein 105 [Sceloporus undulatus]XP_042309271.1 coiled-coil domain-containing protein 105 [Sceloporus undulatus]